MRGRISVTLLGLSIESRGIIMRPNGKFKNAESLSRANIDRLLGAVSA